jgi:hypothetical protein
MNYIFPNMSKDLMSVVPRSAHTRVHFFHPVNVEARKHNRLKNMENLGIDPSTYHMLSDRSTI